MASKFIQLFLVAAMASVIVAQTCPSGQYRDTNNLCQSCLSNCRTCESAEYCTSCNANTFLVIATGSVSCRPCSRVLQGCSICLTNIACKTCATGYVLEADNKCSSCATRIANCSTCSTDGLTCQQCRYPYILTNNTCISSTVEKIKTGVRTVYVNVT